MVGRPKSYLIEKCALTIGTAGFGILSELAVCSLDLRVTHPSQLDE
jgi:hypothetical protein